MKTLQVSDSELSLLGQAIAFYQTSLQNTVASINGQIQAQLPEAPEAPVVEPAGTE